MVGIGLPYEEALTFWRKAFHRMTDEQFQKGGHTYNIRYSYGLEGKRQNYSPYSCVKIITSNHPGAGDHHGCPFKHFGGDGLRTYMSEYIAGAIGEAPSSNTVQAGVQEIMNTTKAGHYQVACTRLFELTHGEKGKEGEKGDVVIEHPNQYFELSLKFGKEEGGDVKMVEGGVKKEEAIDVKKEDVVMDDVVMGDVKAKEEDEMDR
jgi:DNA primase large subunit